ncbi:uncharacterized protein TNCT_691031 [Trichonephila clavata]|uniref:Uncharacterized protein n=1 Tax=Trichonephila clavata TaxID=2740835 RepID=A0A8X6L4Q7_TRICU|nr:uncharacterized protein TNCT_691031 [Trichonephila clavata]
MAILKKEKNCNSRGELKSNSLEIQKSNSETLCENISEKQLHIKYSYADHVSAFNTLALWSDPAWINTNERNSVHFTALSEWVHHHRIWMATNKVTVAEIIGGVRGVIPNSKLATYGDYRYDLDLEEMYDILEELDVEFSNGVDESMTYCNESNFNHDTLIKKLQNPKEYYIDRKFPANISPLSKEIKSKSQTETEKSAEDTSRSLPLELEEWIQKWKTLLFVVKRSISEEKSFDVWTDILLKICNKFLSAIKCNVSLLKLMETDVSFITDYKQLLKEPVTMLELLSIPQPYLKDTLNLDSEQEDILWLKLSSPQIKKLWTKNFINERQERIFSKNSSSLGFDFWIGATNFLRRQRQKTETESTITDDIEISEDEAKELIGSLINYVDGCSSDKAEIITADEMTTSKSASKNYFPEAHGEWTRTLFPRRTDISTEANANISNNCQVYINQSDQHILSKQILSVPPPHLTFPPPLHIPPPPLPSTLHSLSAQTQPFYLPSYHQPLQSYSHDRFRMTVPRNYSSVWLLANGIQQQLQNSTCQSSTSTGHQVFFINRYYNQSQINLPLQTGTSTILQSQINPPAINHKYGGHGNIMTMSTAHLPQTLTNSDKAATQQNEHSLREMSKNRILQNVTNRNFANKHQYLIPEVSQHSMGHNKSSIKNMKSDLSNMQNSLLHVAISKTLQLKQLPILSPELKKMVEMNQLTQLKRIPPGFQNNWQSPCTQKLRKEASSVLLSKHNLLNYTQETPVQKLKQNIYNAEFEFRKEIEKSLQLQGARILKNGIRQTCLNFSDSFKPFNLKSASFFSYSNHQNILHTNKSNYFNYSNEYVENKKETYSRQCCNSQWDHLNDPSVRNVKWKMSINKIRRKQLNKVRAKINHFTALKHQLRNIKKCDDAPEMYSAHKQIWKFTRLHKNDCFIDEYLKLTNNITKQKLQDKKMLAKIFEDKKNRKILESFPNFLLVPNKYKCNGGQILQYDAKNQNKNSHDSKNSKSVKIYNENNGLNLFQFVSSDNNLYNYNKNNKYEYAKHFNMIADKLLFNNQIISDGIQSNKSPSAMHEKIDGWTHFKFAIQVIFRNATHILLNGAVNQMSHSKLIHQYIEQSKDSQKYKDFINK